MQNSIKKQFDFSSLIKFSLPTIGMMLFLSIYIIIDAFFVANYIGSDGVAVLNISYPFYQLIAAFGMMFATGGSAFLAAEMGKGKEEVVNGDFTFIVVASIIVGIIFMIIGLVFIDPVLGFLGTPKSLYEDTKIYTMVTSAFGPVIVFKQASNLLLITAGQPRLGLRASLIGGIFNIALDYLFIVVLKWGIIGAALGTCLAMAFAAAVGFRFFMNENASIHFAKPRIIWSTLLKVSGNGASEMVTQLSIGITTLMFNYILLDLAGTNGVAAISIIVYIQFIMLSVFLGYSSGVAPIISYNYGAQKKEDLHRLLIYCIKFITIVEIIVIIIAYSSTDLLVGLFVSRDNPTYELARNGLIIFSISYIFNGYTIFASSFFTALNNGKISAFLSFLKNLLLQVACLIILPKLIGINGVWLAVPISEGIAFVISLIYIIKYRKVYGY